MSTLKQTALDGRAEHGPAHSGPAAGPPLEPSTTEASAQGPSPRPARAPATVADITRPSPVTVGEYDHVAAAAYLMKHAKSAALVVLGAQHDNPPIGVITEADIARAVADGMDVNTTRGFRQVPVTDGAGWIGIADIADVCGALLGPPAA
jgi:hypothetical protein